MNFELNCMFLNFKFLTERKSNKLGYKPFLFHLFFLKDLSNNFTL